MTARHQATCWSRSPSGFVSLLCAFKLAMRILMLIYCSHAQQHAHALQRLKAIVYLLQVETGPSRSVNIQYITSIHIDVTYL